jgi:hypothetical protein
MLTPFFVDNDGHQHLPDPSDWQLFAYPQQGMDPPRIRIPLQKLSDYGKGKFLGDDTDSDTGSGDGLPLPSAVIPLIIDGGSVAPPARVPLQLISTNLRSSYVRKAKVTKRIAADCFEIDEPVPTKNKKKPAHVSKKKSKPSHLKKVTRIASATSIIPPISHPRSSNLPNLPTAVTNNVVAPSIPDFTSALPAEPFVNGPHAATVGVNNRPSPLLNGTYKSWVNFVDEGGYWLTTEERVAVKRFVKSKRSNPVAVAEGLKFHRLVQSMRSELSSSARDAWDLVLPPRSYPNFEFCCLFLMIATPAVTDDSIILVFGPLFRDHHVTP